MFIVKVWAGYANQMFQYALYKSLLSEGKSVYVDTDTFKPKWDFENIKLIDIFPNIDLIEADPVIVEMLNARKTNVLSKIKRRVLKIFNQSEKSEHFYFEEPKFSYNSFLFDLDGDYYLEGFWQTEKYFENISKEIRNDFTFAPFIDKRNEDLSHELSNNNSICIHVRKGADYKKSITQETCDIQYYRSSIDLMKKKVPNAKFYVFSDNMDWCRDNLGFCELIYIDWNPSTGKGNHYDMQLMSLCKHNIIANSSYSWWGAWLNNNPEKIVIAPKVWFNKKYCSFDTIDIVPDTWIKL
jgi:hypothetical protein